MATNIYNDNISHFMNILENLKLHHFIKNMIVDKNYLIVVVFHKTEILDFFFEVFKDYINTKTSDTLKILPSFKSTYEIDQYITNFYTKLGIN
jgi:translation initiation factor RLI1